MESLEERRLWVTHQFLPPLRSREVIQRHHAEWKGRKKEPTVRYTSGSGWERRPLDMVLDTGAHERKINKEQDKIKNFMMVQTSNLTKFCAMYMYITPFFVVYRCCYSNHANSTHPLTHLISFSSKWIVVDWCSSNLWMLFTSQQSERSPW